MYCPQERIDKNGRTVIAGEHVTIVDHNGDRISGKASFNPSCADTVIVRADGYTYHGSVRTMEKTRKR